jgi:hypothetical protein
MSWCGWLWNNETQTWERVCRGEGLNACNAELRKIATRRDVPSKYTCMTGGAEPTFKPAQAARKKRRRF